MRRMLTVSATAALALFTSQSLAGPNAGGVLFLHAQDSSDASRIEYCGFSGIDDCTDASTSVGGGDSYIVWVMAAFPPQSHPVVKAISFGLDYDTESLVVSDWRSCAEIQFEEANWPTPYTGVALSWGTAMTERVAEIYWFEVYAQPGASGELALMAHPQHGGYFADEAVPAILDHIDDYGSLGIGQSGYAPCARSIHGGCCMDEEVFVMNRSDCESIGGEFFPHYNLGDSIPCLLPVQETSWGFVKWEFADR